MSEMFQFDFMQNAFLAGILIAIACGIVGSLVVVNRMVFISGGIAHASYGGIGMAVFFGVPILLGAGVFSLLTAIIIGLLTIKGKNRIDTIIGAVWAIGMAIGIIFIDMSPGYNTNLMSYLFGSIISVPQRFLFYMASLDIIIAVTVFFFHKEFLAVSYDEEFAIIRGINTKFFRLLLLGLSALTVVMSIQLTGLILVIALLTIPTYIAEKFSGSLVRMMILSSVLGVVFVFAGLVISYKTNLTAGAVIVIISSFAFILSGLFKKYHF